MALLIAKITFYGSRPVRCASLSASLVTTMPTTLPESSSTGSPLLPSCTGTVIWIRRRSLPGSIVALTVPVVLTLCRGLFHGKANNCGDHSHRKQTPVDLHRGRR